MAQVQILNRWSGAVIFKAEIPDDVNERFRVRAALRIAVKSGSDLSGSNLRDSNLSGSNLRDSNLSGAKNLTYDQLIPIRDDLWAVLSAAPNEARGLRQALLEGRVDGSTYEGKCACLVGTIANVRGAKYDALGALKPNFSRPIECWFMGIKKGDTPETNVPAKWAAQWIDEWLVAVKSAFGERAAS